MRGRHGTRLHDGTMLLKWKVLPFLRLGTRTANSSLSSVVSSSPHHCCLDDIHIHIHISIVDIVVSMK
jgi:hypothetical protein